jgi:hypothetical protein
MPEFLEVRMHQRNREEDRDVVALVAQHSYDINSVLLRRKERH